MPYFSGLLSFCFTLIMCLIKPLFLGGGFVVREGRLSTYDFPNKVMHLSHLSINYPVFDYQLNFGWSYFPQSCTSSDPKVADPGNCQRCEETRSLCSGLGLLKLSSFNFVYVDVCADSAMVNQKYESLVETICWHFSPVFKLKSTLSFDFDLAETKILSYTLLMVEYDNSQQSKIVW